MIKMQFEFKRLLSKLTLNMFFLRSYPQISPICLTIHAYGHKYQIVRCFVTNRCTLQSSLLGNQKGSPVLIEKNDLKSRSSFLDKFDTFLLDCDGVLWGTDLCTRFENIGITIDFLRNAGKSVYFVTNNSSRPRASYLSLFKSFGRFEAATKDIYTAPYTAALYLKQVLKCRGTCYVIGNEGISTEMISAGFNVIGPGPDVDPVSQDVDVLLIHKFLPDVIAVVVGFDEYFSYNKLYKATSYLSNPLCYFIATSTLESSVVIGPGRVQPITGCIVEAIKVATNREPIIMGKPNKHMMEIMQADIPNLNIQRTVFIGDSLKTDIAFAKNSGIASALVLTGCNTMEDVEQNVKDKNIIGIPDFILPHLSDIL